MLSQRIGALVAPAIAVLAVAALAVTIWLQAPTTSITIDDPAGVVEAAELVRADKRTDEAGDFELSTASTFCSHYDGTLTVEVQPDGETVALDWAVEPDGECKDEACIPVWVIGEVAPGFRDATFVGTDTECPPEFQP